MSELHCPKCACDYCYHDGEMNICPECAYEWRDGDAGAGDDTPAVLDANGVALADGDSVVLIKALKPKGSSQTIKQGTKVKNIRLQEGDHDIACKVNGTALNLKSEFVKKA